METTEKSGRAVFPVLVVGGFLLLMFYVSLLLGSYAVVGTAICGGSYICILIVVCTQKILKRISALEQNFKGKAEQKD